MFNLNKTIKIIQGGLFNSKDTWQSYLAENHDWKETATLLTGPMILVSVLLSSLLLWLFSSHYLFATQGGFGITLLKLIGAAIGISVGAFLFSFIAGFFKGKHDFNKGLAALSLAAIPGYIGSIVGSVPMIGWLISLGLGIVSLVFLYKIIPSYLEVPEEKRVVHFVTSLVSTVVVAFIINMILGVGAYTAGGFDTQNNQKTIVTSKGIFGNLSRQTDLIEQADNDRFQPPKNGEVTEDQMASLIVILNKTESYRNEQADKMKKMEADMKDKKDFSFSDIGKLTSSIGSVMSLANAEMEVVKSAGANWAEHQWVKNQLHVAKIQKDLNDTVKHNYALYQKYQDQLVGL